MMFTDFGKRGTVREGEGKNQCEREKYQSVAFPTQPTQGPHLQPFRCTGLYSHQLSYLARAFVRFVTALFS